MIRVHFRIGRNTIKSKLYPKANKIYVDVDRQLWVVNDSQDYTYATYAQGEWMRTEAEEPDKEKTDEPKDPVQP